MNARLFFWKILPRPLAKSIQTVRWKGFLTATRMGLLWAKHRFRNRELPAGMLRIAGSPIICYSPKADEAFNHFIWFDPDMVDELQDSLRVSQKCHTFLDIGALYGLFSLLFSSQNNRTSFAFEPMGENYSLLTEHCRLNPALKVEPKNIALGEQNNQIRMARVAGHLVACTSRIPQEDNEIVNVETMTADDFCATSNITPDAVKIDVEGYELFVLRGAQKILSDPSMVVFLEIHPELIAHHGHSVQDIFKFLQTLGFYIYHKKLRKPVEDDFIPTLDNYGCIRIIASKSGAGLL
jgi:FkbM family methyltransferase